MYLDEKMDSSVIKEGSYVMIKGLKQNFEFNGLYGKVVGYHQDDKRWNIELSKSVQPQNHISVKTDNLKHVSKGTFFYCFVYWLTYPYSSS